MIERFKKSNTKEVKRLGDILQHWRHEVLNYFRKRLINARPEGFNNKASFARRRAYEYKNIGYVSCVSVVEPFAHHESGRIRILIDY